MEVAGAVIIEGDWVAGGKGGFKDLAQQMEWQGFFKENQLKAVALKEQIDKTNSEIDEMVFGLYGLSHEEIGIVRG